MNHLTSWEEEMQRRLASHQATPPAMGWEKLQERMKEQPLPAPSPKAKELRNGKRERSQFPPFWGGRGERLSLLWRWGSGLALTAAACAALVFLLNPSGDGASTSPSPIAQSNGISESGNISESNGKTNGASTEKSSLSSEKHEESTRHLAKASLENVSTGAEPLLTYAASVGTDKVETVLPHEENTVQQQAPAAPKAEEKKQEKAIPFKTTADNEEELQHKLFVRQRETASSGSKKARTERHLAFAIHGSTPQNDSRQKEGYANPSLLLANVPSIASLPQEAGDMNAIVSNNLANDVDTHVRHHTPLQLGFSVAYAFNDRWSLSTGLTYTRLTTDIESGFSTSYYLTSQKLHYVGLPLTVRFTAFSSRYFDAYISAGGMIEKCVNGEQTTTYQMSESHRSNSGTTDHVGRGLWQASLNGSAGVQFNILPSLGLYFEPGLTWYADDHSSLPSIRHDKPWQFTMQGGLRLTLGK